MSRLLFAAALLLAACVAAPLSSCTADTTESCIGGPCTLAGSGGASSAVSSSGTGGGPGADACMPVSKTGDFPCDVFAVIHTNCNPCHQMPPLNNAPFPLLVYADTQAPYEPGKLIFQQMYDQTRPGAAPRMPFGGMLSDPDYAMLSAWLLACAPPVAAGTGCGCPGTGCN